MEYGQFCPIAKATEVVGEKWTLLIIRELLMGASRFNQLVRGLGGISPALLTTRLNSLIVARLVVRRKISGQRGYEYFPTEACNELLPILRHLGVWGMRWAKDNLVDEDYDVDLLMLYLERTVVVDKIPGTNAVIRFSFDDLKEQRHWWLVVHSDRTEVCVKDPGQEVDVYLRSTLRTMTDVWLGHRSYASALRSGDLKLTGTTALTQTAKSWLRCTEFQQAG